MSAYKTVRNVYPRQQKISNQSWLFLPSSENPSGMIKTGLVKLEVAGDVAHPIAEPPRKVQKSESRPVNIGGSISSIIDEYSKF